MVVGLLSSSRSPLWRRVPRTEVAPTGSMMNHNPDHPEIPILCALGANLTTLLAGSRSPVLGRRTRETIRYFRCCATRRGGPRVRLRAVSLGLDDPGTLTAALGG